MKPIIFMYSSVEKDDILEQCRNLGIQQYLTKPVKMKDFFKLLHEGKARSGEKSGQKVPASDISLTIDPGKTILIASHDPLVFASPLADLVVEMRDGCITSGGSAP